MTSSKEPKEMGVINQQTSNNLENKEISPKIAENLMDNLLSQEVLLSDDDIKCFTELKGGLTDHFKPIGTTEKLIVDYIFSALWRLKLIIRAETNLIKPCSLTIEKVEVELQFLCAEKKQKNREFAKICKFAHYEATLRSQLFKSLRELKKLQTARQSAPILEPLDFNFDEIFTYGDTENYENS
jgi:hypothetical protein